MRNNEIIEVEGKLYEVIRTISVEQVRDRIDMLKAWQQYNHCDRIFRKENRYYLVRDIDDVEFEYVENEKEISATEGLGSSETH